MSANQCPSSWSCFYHALIIITSLQLLHQQITEPDVVCCQLDFAHNAWKVPRMFQCLSFAQCLGNQYSSLRMLNLFAAFQTIHLGVKLCGLYRAHQPHAFLITKVENTETLVTVCSRLNWIFALYTKRESEENTPAQLCGTLIAISPSTRS